jgi:hypothetical protein
MRDGPLRSSTLFHLSLKSLYSEHLSLKSLYSERFAIYAEEISRDRRSRVYRLGSRANLSRGNRLQCLIDLGQRLGNSSYGHYLIRVATMG